jgi:hypothetical protein
MDKHNFRYYVIVVTTDDEYGDEATHVAIHLRPSEILRLAVANLTAWFIHNVFRWVSCHIEIAFPEITWLNFNQVDADFPEKWEAGAVEDEIDPAIMSERGLINHYAQAAGDGGLWFVCNHKHGGEEYMSHEVELRELVKTIRLSDVLAELREWIGKARFAGGTSCPEH